MFVNILDKSKCLNYFKVKPIGLHAKHNFNWKIINFV